MLFVSKRVKNKSYNGANMRVHGEPVFAFSPMERERNCLAGESRTAVLTVVSRILLSVVGRKADISIIR